MIQLSRVGIRIKTARELQNISSKQLAKKCGVSQSYIDDIESGKKVISDSIIKRLSGLLNIDFSDSLYTEGDDVEEAQKVNREKVEKPKKVVEEWENAFSSIIRDIPVYNMSMDKALEHRHLPIIDKKVEGYNPDKLVFIKAPDNSLSGFRIRKDDIVMVVLNSEIPGSGFCIMEYDGIRAIRSVKKLDGNKVLILSHHDNVKTETKDIREIKVLGHCIRVEIDLKSTQH